MNPQSYHGNIQPMPLGYGYLSLFGRQQFEVKQGSREGVQLPFEYLTWRKDSDEQEHPTAYAKDVEGLGKPNRGF